jgi:Mg-chelatase subunit ChlD
MSFERAWALVFAALPLVWLWMEWPRATRRRGLVLKAACLLAIVLALSDPRTPVWETKVAVTVLADTSASLSAADLEKAAGIVAALENARGRHRMRVVPFARETRELEPAETARGFRLRPTSGPAGRGTDIEAAVRDAAASAPEGLVPRIVVISDGNENLGSVARAAWQARQLGIPVDTYRLGGRRQPDLRLDAVRLPPIAFSGERFPIEMLIHSPRAAEVTVEISAEGRALGSQTASLDTGDNVIRAAASLASAGVIEVAGAIRGPGELGEVRFARAITLRRPRMLYASNDPPGVETHLLGALTAAQFDVTSVRDLGSGPLDGFDLIVLNNWDLESIPPARKADLETFVQRGGGMLVIGGERNVWVDKKGIEDALDRALPAKLAPPRSPEGTCVVLIVDKSSSMEGKKMELARIAAIGVVENLRPIDMVGVLIFDNSFQWAVPIRRAEDRPLIKRLVAGITPDGGTQIAPALAEAHKRILPVQATFKHIVLLTDGISEEGDSIAVSKEAASKQITISTVGLGQDVNRAYLEKVAQFAKGKSYFLSDPSGLEQILLRDVMEHTGSTAVEKPLKPELVREDEVLEGIDVASAPALKGYVRYQAKPAAQTILRIDQKEPLLAGWQYGLGRAAVFTSDAKARWAADWVSWPGFDKLWTNLSRSLLPRSQPGEAELSFDSASGEIIAQYRLGARSVVPARLPELFAFGPDGFRRPLALQAAAAGTYRGRVHIGARKGLFRVRPVEELREFPEIGVYIPDDELNEFGSNAALLERLSSFTGGRAEPRASQVFDAGGRALASEMNLWPALLALALLLNIAELIDRKWKALRELFARR